MKTIILSIAVLLAITSQSQVSVNAGLSSRFSAAFKVAVEKQTGWNNTELSTMVSIDNYRPIVSLTTGIGTQHEGEYTNYRLMAGVYYHTGLLPVDKDIRCQVIKFGGSFRWQVRSTLFTIEYTGETLNLSLGYLIGRK